VRLRSQDIHDGAKDGKLDAVEELVLSDPTCVNMTDDSDDTPLHIAATSGHSDRWSQRREQKHWKHQERYDCSARNLLGKLRVHVPVSGY